MPGLFVQRHALSVSEYCKVSTLYVKSYADQNSTEFYKSSIPFDELRIYSHKSKCVLINYLRFVIHHIKGFQQIRKTWGKKPDVVHVNVLTREGVMALLFQLIWGVPYVVTEHWSRYGNPETFRGPVLKFFTQLVLNRAKCVMPVTKNLQGKMENAGLKFISPVEIVPNVVDTNRFRPLPQMVKNEKTRIVHISCFDEKAKNVKGILRVIKALSLERADFEMIFIGDGVDFDAVKQYAESLSFKAGVIQFKGLMEGDALIAEIQQADVHLMFSNYENLPVVNLECFACGVPVISSDVGGIHEFFNTELGVLVEPGNEQKLEAALHDFLNGKTKYSPERIRAYAVENFSYNRVGEKLYSIYKKALAPQKP